jgi:purine-binding chemotaxis protein CheW
MSARRSLVLFHVSGQAYALPLDAVQEVLPMAELSRPPASPAALAGLLNLEGELVAVIRLSHLFGLPARPTELYTPLLLLKSAQPQLALLVDQVDRIVALDEDAVTPLPESQSVNDCVVGLIEFEQQSVLLLDVPRILLAREREFLADFTASEQQRLSGLEANAP